MRIKNPQPQTPRKETTPNQTTPHDQLPDPRPQDHLRLTSKTISATLMTTKPKRNLSSTLGKELSSVLPQHPEDQLTNHNLLLLLPAQYKLLHPEPWPQPLRTGHSSFKSHLNPSNRYSTVLLQTILRLLYKTTHLPQHPLLVRPSDLEPLTLLLNLPSSIVKTNCSLQLALLPPTLLKRPLHRQPLQVEIRCTPLSLSTILQADNTIPSCSNHYLRQTES